jgi:hypothetical protein
MNAASGSGVRTATAAHWWDDWGFLPRSRKKNATHNPTNSRAAKVRAVLFHHRFVKKSLCAELGVTD